MFWEEKELKKKRKKSGAGRIVLNVVIVLLAGVFIYSAYRLYGIVSVYYQNWKLQSEIQDLFYHQTSQSTPETVEQQGQEEPILENPLAPIQEINGDVVAWICIQDTTVDYPVVQGTDNDYYLNHDIEGNSSICGSIFMDYRNQPWVQQENYVLYGHRMKDDSMFGNLVKFTEEDFYRQHPEFTLITQDAVYTCEIFAVYRTTTEFVYNQTQFSSDSEYLGFVETCRMRSMYQSDTEIAAADSIITLSTCDYTLDANDGRLVIQAKIISNE